jgi:hypothetical protein
MIQDSWSTTMLIPEPGDVVRCNNKIIDEDRSIIMHSPLCYHSPLSFGHGLLVLLPHTIDIESTLRVKISRHSYLLSFRFPSIRPAHPPASFHFPAISFHFPAISLAIPPCPDLSTATTTISNVERSIYLLLLHHEHDVHGCSKQIQSRVKSIAIPFDVSRFAQRG